MNQPTRKIKIVLTARTKVRAGVEEHILSILQSLNTGMYQTYIVADPDLIKAFGNDLLRLPVTVFPISIRNNFDLNAARLFIKFAKSVKPDIVHSHMFIAGFFYAPLARVAGVPIIIETVHGIERHRVEKGIVGRLSFQIDRLWSFFTDAYLSVSHACTAEMKKYKCIPQRKIFTIHNGRDLTFYRPSPVDVRNEIRQELGVEKKDFIFGVIGRLDYQKGHTYLLKASKKLKDKGMDFRLLFVGDGPYRDRLQEEAGRLNLQDKIIWTGFRSDTVRLFAAMDVKVLPSLYEGLPLVAIEALATETPMIATRVDGNPEVIIHKKTGIICHERDPDDLANAMAWSHKHIDEMKLMAKRGREYVLEEFSIEKQMAETEALYLKMVEAKI